VRTARKAFRMTTGLGGKGRLYQSFAGRRPHRVEADAAAHQGVGRPRQDQQQRPVARMAPQQGPGRTGGRGEVAGLQRLQGRLRFGEERLAAPGRPPVPTSYRSTGRPQC